MKYPTLLFNVSLIQKLEILHDKKSTRSNKDWFFSHNTNKKLLSRALNSSRFKVDQTQIKK